MQTMSVHLKFIPEKQKKLKKLRNSSENKAKLNKNVFIRKNLFTLIEAFSKFIVVPGFIRKIGIVLYLPLSDLF